MNKTRKKSFRNNTINENKKITRCKHKMLIVFESDTCDNFSKKENTDANIICKNCINSF